MEMTADKEAQYKKEMHKNRQRVARARQTENRRVGERGERGRVKTTNAVIVQIQ